jgi:hypothetical protein
MPGIRAVPKRPSINSKGSPSVDEGRRGSGCCFDEDGAGGGAVRPFWPVATYWTVSMKFSVHKNLLTMDVVFELINRELLITDYAFDKIPD